MASQYNNELTVNELNKALEAIKAPFTAMVGKRAIKWFKNYNFGGGAYSTSIGEVRLTVACIGDYDSSRLDRMIADAHDTAFFAEVA